jgi:hypothetical protein
MARLGWDALDVILVSGDSYIDSPFIGVAVIGKLLVRAGYRVGVIAQPGTHGLEDIGRLGPPALFWGVTAGSIDSMVANYTALKKKRKQDDYTPGGENTRRPDRATIVYTNLIRRYAKSARLYSARWCWAGSRPACGGWRIMISGATACAARCCWMPRPIICCTVWLKRPCWPWRKS